MVKENLSSQPSLFGDELPKNLGETARQITEADSQHIVADASTEVVHVEAQKLPFAEPEMSKDVVSSERDNLKAWKEDHPLPERSGRDPLTHATGIFTARRRSKL